MDSKTITQLTANIVSAYISNNRADVEDVTAMIGNVGNALRTAAAPPAVVAEVEQPRKRQVVRRRGGKVVDDNNPVEALAEDAANDELVDGGEKISDEENVVEPAPEGSDDNEYNEHGHKKLPEPMFED